MPAILELYLEHLQVVENGRDREDEGVNALAATLYYPRENVPSVTAIRPLHDTLRDRGTLDYSRRPLHERLLFKQTIRGSSMLSLTLSATTHASKLDRFFHRVLGAAWIAGIGTLTGVIGAIPSAILGHTSASLFDLATPEDRITVIGRGIYPIREDMDDQHIPVQLALRQELVVTKTEQRDGARVQENRIYPAGFGNAQVMIHVKRISG